MVEAILALAGNSAVAVMYRIFVCPFIKAVLKRKQMILCYLSFLLLLPANM
jgi:hypothetical protein